MFEHPIPERDGARATVAPGTCYCCNKDADSRVDMSKLERNGRCNPTLCYCTGRPTNHTEAQKTPNPKRTQICISSVAPCESHAYRSQLALFHPQGPLLHSTMTKALPSLELFMVHGIKSMRVVGLKGAGMGLFEFRFNPNALGFWYSALTHFSVVPFPQGHVGNLVLGMLENKLVPYCLTLWWGHCHVTFILSIHRRLV